MKRWRGSVLALGVFLAGCLFDSEPKGVAGTWIYEYDAFLSDALPYTKTYSFSESGSVRFEHRVVDAVVDSFSGTWSLQGDSLRTNRVSCSRPDSAGVFVPYECSGPPYDGESVYWDGDRIYGVNSSNGMRQYYERK